MTERAPEYSPASPRDTEAIRRLLAASGLPCDDIEPHLGDFFVAKFDDALVGVAGVEIVGTLALLRSVAVAASHQSNGLAATLCGKALARARERGVTHIFLLTTTAADYFRKKFGFAPMERSAAPQAVQDTHEFSHGCPQTAALLSRRI